MSKKKTIYNTPSPNVIEVMSSKPIFVVDVDNRTLKNKIADLESIRDLQILEIERLNSIIDKRDAVRKKREDLRYADGYRNGKRDWWKVFK